MAERRLNCRADVCASQSQIRWSVHGWREDLLEKRVLTWRTSFMEPVDTDFISDTLAQCGSRQLEEER